MSDEDMWHWWHVEGRVPDLGPRAWRGRAVSDEHARTAALDAVPELAYATHGLRTSGLDADYDGIRGELVPTPDGGWAKAPAKCADCGLPIEPGQPSMSPNGTTEARRHDGGWTLSAGCQHALVRHVRALREQVERLEALVGVDGSS